MLDLQEAYQKQATIQTSEGPLESKGDIRSALHIASGTLGSLAAHVEAPFLESTDMQWDFMDQAVVGLTADFHAPESSPLDSAPTV